MVAVLASRFSIHERGAVIEEVSNVRIYSNHHPSCSVNSKIHVQIYNMPFCQMPITFMLVCSPILYIIFFSFISYHSKINYMGTF
jgi:hypothetical protein